MDVPHYAPRNSGLALITGAARRLGREIALALAKEGYAIGLHYHHSNQQADETAALLRKTGAEVVLLQADLTDAEQVRRMFLELDRFSQPLRVLVNSAGMMKRSNLMDISAEEWDLTLALNLRAPFFCAQQAARRMAEQGGTIINISDAGAQKAWTTYPAYTISKAGLEVLTRLLARSLAPAIRVNAVAPGLILPSENVTEETWQRLIDRLPMKRAGAPADIARAVVFLTQNDYITGQTLVVDGGYQIL